MLEKIESWKEVYEWDDIVQGYERLTERFECDRFGCPECGQLLIAPIGTIKFYKFCPFCGNRRITDERN